MQLYLNMCIYRYACAHTHTHTYTFIYIHIYLYSYSEYIYTLIQIFSLKNVKKFCKHVIRGDTLSFYLPKMHAIFQIFRFKTTCLPALYWGWHCLSALEGNVNCDLWLKVIVFGFGSRFIQHITFWLCCVDLICEGISPELFWWNSLFVLRKRKKLKLGNFIF